MAEPIRVRVDSLSAAEDLGLLGLRDLAKAADGTDYRVVGGHMVQLLQLVYPTTTKPRGTADVDAAIPHDVEAVGRGLHKALTGIGYVPVNGNRYARPSGPDPGQKVVIDLLLRSPDSTRRDQMFAGRQFDAVPGLNLAMLQEPILVHADVVLRSGEAFEFVVPIPGIEAALILKAAAWESRKETKDLEDISTLLEIAAAHRDSLPSWGLSDPGLGARGSRLDACRTLHGLADALDRRRIPGLPTAVNAPRLSALIRTNALRPR